MGLVVVHSELRYRTIRARTRLIFCLIGVFVELSCSLRLVELRVGASFVCRQQIFPYARQIRWIFVFSRTRNEVICFRD